MQILDSVRDSELRKAYHPRVGPAGTPCQCQLVRCPNLLIIPCETNQLQEQAVFCDLPRH